MSRTDESGGARLGTFQVLPVPHTWPPVTATAAPGESGQGRPAGQPARRLVTAPGLRTASESEAAEPAAWPRQFAVLLAEVLGGVRPASQLKPWLSDRAEAQARRLAPLFARARQLRIARVITTRPARDAIEITVIVDLGPRTRALAIRLELGTPAAAAPRWLCTAVEAA